MLHYVFWSEIYEFVFRCIDIQQSNEVERTQALRLVRKVRPLTLCSYFFLRIHSVCFFSVLNVIFLRGSDDNGECAALPEVCDEFFDRRGERRTAGERSDGASVYRHHL